MPYAELNANTMKIEITTTYADRYLIRQLPGANWDSDAQKWHVPVSWPACVTLRGLFQWDLEVGPGLTAWANAEYAMRINPAMVLRDKLALDAEAFASTDLEVLWAALSVLDDEAPEDRKLFPYQKVDVIYLSLVKCGILANPMGLGKSASMIRNLQLLSGRLGMSPFPALIICPNTVKMTWAGELEKFAPELDRVVVQGSMGQRRKQIQRGADITIINWEALRGHTRLAGYGSMALTDAEKTPKELNEAGYRTVIADEAHHAKDPHAKQTRAMWAVMKQAEYRYLLTGTPVGDHVGDLWSLLHAVEPDAFPAKTKYLDRWARIELNFFGGSEMLGLKPETTEEFYKATRPLFRRVPKAAALPQLPKRLPQAYRFCEMSTQQAKMYQQMEKKMIAEVEGEDIIFAPNAIAKMTRLLQFAAASANVEETGKLQCVSCKRLYPEGAEACEDCENAALQVHTQVRLVMPSSKVEDVLELLREMDEDPLVVAAVSTQLLNLTAQRLERAGITYGLITGEQDLATRQANVEAFQEGKLRVILLNIDAGGEGITLTKAWTLLFMQRHWSKIKNDQVEDRLDRIGQEQPVQVIDQVTPDTVEYRKFQVIQDKETRIEEILQDKAILLKLLGV